MADHYAGDWRELCDAALAALAAQDTNNLLQILQELDAVLGREESFRSEARARNGTRPSSGRSPREAAEMGKRPQPTHRSLGNVVGLE